MIWSVLLAALGALGLTAVLGLVGLGIRETASRFRTYRAGPRFTDPFLGATFTVALLSMTYVVGTTRGLAIGILILAGAGGVSCLAAWCRSHGRPKSSPLSTVVVAVSIAAISWAILPSVSAEGTFGFTTGVGPDAIGYGISGQAIANHVTRNEIVDSLSTTWPLLPINSVLSPLTGAIYDLASFTNQVQAEFIIGAGRVGWAAPHGLLIDLLGFENTWFAAQIMCGSAILMAILLVWSALRDRAFTHFRVSAFAFLVASNAVVLYAWHQGGLGQIWALPASLAIVIGFAPRRTNIESIGLIACGTAFLAYSYIDALPVLIILLGIVTLMRLIRISEFSNTLNLGFAGLGLGLLIALPKAITLPQMMASRAVDAGQSGWEVPTALSLRTLLGIGPFLNFGSNNAIGGDLAHQIFTTLSGLAVASACVIALLVILRAITHCPWDYWISLAVASLLTIVLVFLQTQLIYEHTNYQLVKTGTLLLPALLAGLLLSEWRGPRTALLLLLARANPSILTGFRVLVGFSMVAALCLAGYFSLRFVSDYRATAFYANQASTQDAYTQEVRDLLNGYGLVASSTLGWDALVLGSMGDYSWLNRGGVKALTGVRKDLELAILARTPALPDMSGSPRTSLSPMGIKFGTHLAVLPLGRSVLDAQSLSGEAICDLSGVLWAEKTGVMIEGCSPERPLKNAKLLTLATSTSKASRLCSTGQSPSSVLVVGQRRLGDYATWILLEMEYPSGVESLWIDSAGLVRWGVVEDDSRQRILGSTNDSGLVVVKMSISGSTGSIAVNGGRASAVKLREVCSIVTLGGDALSKDKGLLHAAVLRNSGELE